ncbi:FAR-17a/AIG1-like protein [Aureococcus anophagefferens]|nr:FAR-17a/AIG1-like protein [Aureococcus anophagefferens]
MSPALISLICAVGNAVGFAGHLFMPPCWLRSPQKTRVFGRWTFLTNQSNAILVCYHALRFAAPAHALARRAYPLAFALGVGLTLLYYGLDHFHGLALPLALLDARYGGHAGESTGGDVVVLVGGFAAFYLLGTLLNKKLTGLWLYPISDELEKALGPAGFWVLSIPVTVTYVTLGFVGRHVAG